MVTHGWISRTKLAALFISIVITVLLLTVVWILSILGILSQIWSMVMSIFFTVLGFVVSLCQLPWENMLQVKTGTLVIRTNSKLRGKSISLLEGFVPTHGISISSPITSASSVLEHAVGGNSEFLASFECLVPGRYTAFVYDGPRLLHHAPIVIFAERVTEIDWS